MSTWQIFSDAGNNFRWEVSGKIIHSESSANEPNGAAVQTSISRHRLPSMEDLLLQGCSKLLEKSEEEGAGIAPMFRTGSGKSVALKQSSIAKALSVLGDNAAAATASSTVGQRDNASGLSNSLFSTASGKSVDISSAGLVRAKTLLGLEEDNDYSNFQVFQQPRKLAAPNGAFEHQNLSSLKMMEGIKKSGIADEASPELLPTKLQNSAPKPSPIKFHTAGGRSLSISSDALERARSLLGDPDVGSFLNEGEAVDSAHQDSSFHDVSFNKGKNLYSGFTHPGAAKSKNIPKTCWPTFISPLKSSTLPIQSVNAENNILGDNLITKFDAVGDGNVCALDNDTGSVCKPLRNGSSVPATKADNSLSNCISSRITPLAGALRVPLVDISNTNEKMHANNGQTNSQKKRPERGSYISPFKRPRCSKFKTPLNKNVSSVPSGLPTLSSGTSGRRRTISVKYPFQFHRMYIREYFGAPFSDKSKIEIGEHPERWITSDTADKYTFYSESGPNCIGADAFYDMLARSGASVQHASKGWVTNHYKWIVWKLACYERSRPAKSTSNFLTVSNVLEELKYRYEREANHGHRSAIKRILDGDAQPSSMMILCISATHFSCEQKNETHTVPPNGTESSNAAKVELTDGWYSLDAFLDASLSKCLAAGKLFVGQKLRLWGAGIYGWAGPVSPLEASREVSLLLHINGTYRTHWAERLGFCKGVGAPLAFRCIKSNGGPVPQTLIGVTRIYPLLYKEKLSNGGSIVRSERMESKLMQLYNQRRTALIEGIVSEFQRGMKGSHIYCDSDSEEGAKILKLLETAAEPEVLMAEMRPEQLASFASYQAKVEATSQLDMQRAIEKALQDAGLGVRDVTPFMRIRVVGLSNGERKKGVPKEGIITIWNPTEKQQSDLAEGQAYCVAGLVPVNSESNTLYLQAKGTSTKWHLLSPTAIQSFQPFFSPRASASLLSLGEVPLSSEFDIAAFVLYVGEVYKGTQQMKQWVFVCDSSISSLQSEDTSKSLLAISFSSPYVEEADSFSPINCNLVGSTVGFHNLIKRARDTTNDLWIAEATENSTYWFNFDSPNCAHLKNAAASTRSWANNSGLIIEELKEKVLFIIGDCKG